MKSDNIEDISLFDLINSVMIVYPNMGIDFKDDKIKIYDLKAMKQIKQ